MNYKTLNPIDEQGRLMRLPSHYEATSGSQYDSHGYSYLFTRQQYENMGEIMGLDKLVLEE